MAFDPTKRLPAPCVGACPAQIDIPRYIGYVERGQFAEAHAVVRESIPLPVVCGLICYRPCEPWCRRGIMEQPVAINALKRAATEHAPSARAERGWDRPVAAATGKRVAIVGSGPAGLTAAYYLASRRGHEVTLYEAMPELGGQLRIGLPEYKVPRDRLRQEIAQLLGPRVEVRAGVWVESLDSLLTAHDAVLLAVGHGEAVPLGIEGEDLEGVGKAADFLREVNLGRLRSTPPRVLVIGGNNIAFDSARCAVRLGSREVRVIYPGPMEETPAHDFEVRAAVEEGVQFEGMARPRRITRAGPGLLVEIERLEVATRDEWGRAKGEGTGNEGQGTRGFFTLEAEAVLVSVGQRVKAPPAWGLRLDERGFIEVERETLRTSRERVFAAGDAVTGPDSVVEALAQGKRAAVAMDRFLGGDGDISERFAPEPGEEMVMPGHLAEQGKPVVPMALADLDRRRRTFALVELGYGKGEAVAEARRCIRCDLWRTGAPEVWAKQRG